MAGIDKLYVKDKKGILKKCEVIFTCIAFACMIVANEGFYYPYNNKYNTRYDLFLAAHIIAFVVAIIIYLVHLFSVQDTLGSTKIWKMVNFIFCGAFAVLCVISAGLMIEYAENEHQSPLYRAGYRKWRWYTNHRIVAIAFGFFSSVVLVVDAFFQFMELR